MNEVIAYGLFGSFCWTTCRSIRTRRVTTLGMKLSATRVPPTVIGWRDPKSRVRVIPGAGGAVGSRPTVGTINYIDVESWQPAPGTCPG